MCQQIRDLSVCPALNEISLMSDKQIEALLSYHPVAMDLDKLVQMLESQILPLSRVDLMSTDTLQLISLLSKRWMSMIKLPDMYFLSYPLAYLLTIISYKSTESFPRIIKHLPVSVLESISGVLSNFISSPDLEYKSILYKLSSLLILSNKINADLSKSIASQIEDVDEQFLSAYIEILVNSLFIFKDEFAAHLNNVFYTVLINHSCKDGCTLRNRMIPIVKKVISIVPISICDDLFKKLDLVFDIELSYCSGSIGFEIASLISNQRPRPVYQLAFDTNSSF